MNPLNKSIVLYSNGSIFTYINSLSSKSALKLIKNDYKKSKRFLKGTLKKTQNQNSEFYKYRKKTFIIKKCI